MKVFNCTYFNVFISLFFGLINSLTHSLSLKSLVIIFYLLFPVIIRLSVVMLFKYSDGLMRWFESFDPFDGNAIIGSTNCLFTNRGPRKSPFEPLYKLSWSWFAHGSTSTGEFNVFALVCCCWWTFPLLNLPLLVVLVPTCSSFWCCWCCCGSLLLLLISLDFLLAVPNKKSEINNFSCVCNIFPSFFLSFFSCALIASSYPPLSIFNTIKSSLTTKFNFNIQRFNLF